MRNLLGNTAAAEFEPAFCELCGAVGQTLTSLGIFPNLKGYAVLKDAVLIRIQGFYDGKTDSLYEQLAALHDCEPKTVEGNIRSAIRAAANSGMLMRINDLIGAQVVDEPYCHLSSMQFIALLAHYFIYNFLPNDI